MAKKLSDKQIEEIIKLYNDRNSATAIAKRFECGLNFILRTLRKKGIKIRGPGDLRFLDLDYNGICKLYQEGNSTYKLGKMFNVAPSTIFLVLKRFGIQLRSHKEATTIKAKKASENFWNLDEVKKQNEIIIREYKKGTPYKLIEEMVGLKERAILKRVKRFGIKTRKYVYKDKSKQLSEDKDTIIDSYEAGYSTTQIGKSYGISHTPIARLLKNNDIELLRPYYYSSIRRAEDGHLVRSSLEIEADNWLFRNRIAHIYERNIGETRFKCDFYIPDGNIYIEIFGLHTKEYKERMKQKIQLYKDFGLLDKLIMIFPRDDMVERLKPLLKYSQIQKQLNEFEGITE